MSGKSRPRPCFLEEQIKFGIRGGQQVWKNVNGSRLYTWDSLHGDIEAFNNRGSHLGSLDPFSGELIKPAVKGRKIDV